MESLKVRPEILNALQQISEANNLTNFRIVDLKTNKKGEGFLGEIFKITIKDEVSERKINVVLKVAFQDNKVRAQAPIKVSFHNEIYFYSTVLKTINKFATNYGVNNKLDIFPKCLQLSLDENAEVLALENLFNQNFELFDRELILDHDHVKLIFETYGRFHGFSYAFHDQQPEEFEKFSRNLVNVYDIFETDMQKFFSATTKLAGQCLIPGKDDELIEKYKKYHDAMEIFKKTTVANNDYPAILHGDCWSNNMMFKYELQEGTRKPVDLKLLDFQFIRRGSPVCDLAYCLYSGASKEVFKDFDIYLKIYHDSLSSFIRELGSDPDKLYPFSALKEEWKKYAKFGFVMSCIVIKMKTTSQEDILDFTDVGDQPLDELFGSLKYNKEEYDRRIRDVIEHMDQVGAL